jgi:hypothetical protein
MSRDWSKHPGFRKFARQVAESTMPHMAESAYVITIAPPTGTEADVKQAVEIGLAILMDKPLIIFAPKGRTVADRLLRIADHVVEADMDTEAGRAEAMRKLEAVMNQ